MNIAKLQPRLTLQIVFIILCLWIGIEFILFVTFFESQGVYGSFTRPPGVDGFLPISSLMNFLYYLKSGEIHPYHPAGLFIFLAICTLSLVIGKSFCSWLCFIGTLSEKLADFAEQKFKIKITLPIFIDLPLRSLKYLLLFFFLYHILGMEEDGLKAFLDGDYNLIADIKMYYFFAHISQTAFIVIGILTLSSFFIRNFWCRYLCPYGAFLGFISFFSPFKIKRENSTCINCDKCTQACPSRINVAKKDYVISDECSSCLRCVEACPVKDTLHLKVYGTKKTLSSKMVAIIICTIFICFTGFAMITNKWKNNVSIDGYNRAYKTKDFLKHH